MNSILFGKVIWAIDVFESKENHAQALRLIGAIAKPTDAKIEPVFVQGAAYNHVEGEAPPFFNEAYHSLAEKRIANLSQTTDVSLLPGKILASTTGGIRNFVQTLVDYAKTEKAKAIVVATHGRKGLSRFMLGSFAETLVTRSPIPIFTVNPDARLKERISSILLPTTFQKKYRTGFEQAVQLARALDARLTLFYKEPIIPGAYMTPEVFHYMEQASLQRMQTAKEWQDWASQNRVKADIHIDNQPGYVSSSIAELAESKNFDLICMISQSDSLSAAISGSTSRSVIRTAGCPVWITRVDF